MCIQIKAVYIPSLTKNYLLRNSVLTHVSVILKPSDYSKDVVGLSVEDNSRDGKSGVAAFLYLNSNLLEIHLHLQRLRDAPCSADNGRSVSTNNACRKLLPGGLGTAFQLARCRCFVDWKSYTPYFMAADKRRSCRCFGDGTDSPGSTKVLSSHLD